MSIQKKIDEKRYAAEMATAGMYGICFSGKRVELAK